MDRPRIYTRAQAADRAGVSVRTVEQWHADRWLDPIPGSRRVLGHWLYTEPALVAAEKRARWGRTRRRRTLSR